MESSSESQGTALGPANRAALDARFGTPAAGDGHVIADAARVLVRVVAAEPHARVEVQAAGGSWMRLVSARDPEAEAAAWLDRAQPALGDGTVILVGGGLGYALDVLEHRGASPRVVIVEPDAALARLMLDRRDWRRWIDEGRLAVVTGPQYHEVPAVARQVTGLDAAPVLVHPALARAWPDGVREAQAAAEQLQFEAAANAEARRTLGGRYLRQTLANATRLAREADAARLRAAFAGTPAVIVAAGPSLDRNLHDLHAIRDRALVVACDTALRPLLTVGLDPQLVVAIDPSVANACHLGALHEPRRTWLAAEASLHPPAFAHFEGRTFTFRITDHDPWPWLRAAGLDRLHVEAWGSVVTAAFDLVLRLGCDPVIFAGTDLAFTEGRPYCRGTTLEAQWASWVAGGDSYARAFAMLRDRWPAVRVPDIRGDACHTAGHLVAFRDWLVARSARARPVRVVNATGAGILHGASINQATAADTLAGARPLDPEAVQATLRAAHHPVDARGALFERIAALEHTGWPWPERWLAVEPAPDAGALRDLLAGPEYAAWRLGRIPSYASNPS